MEALAPVGFVLLVLAVVAWVVVSYVLDSRRRQALQGFAASKGWAYTAQDDSFAGRWQGTPFGRGEDRHCRSVLSGADRGRPFVAFDYSYVTESTDGKGRRSRTTHRCAVVALGLPAWLPGVQVVPDGLLHRAAEAVGVGVGIQLESEDFNRRFTVTAHDPKFASDVITPRTMEVLMRAQALAWRIEGSDVLAWDTGTTRPLDVLARLALLHAVVEGIPGFVWHDNGYRADDHRGDGPAAGHPAPPTEGGTS